MSKVATFDQSNLTRIDKRMFRKLHGAIESNTLLSGTDRQISESKKGWRCFRQDEFGENVFLLVSHFERKDQGGLQLAYKADKELLEQYKKQK